MSNAAKQRLSLNKARHKGCTKYLQDAAMEVEAEETIVRFVTGPQVKKCGWECFPAV